MAFPIRHGQNWKNDNHQNCRESSQFCTPKDNHAEMECAGDEFDLDIEKG